jgi:hypothetical protein
MNNSSLGGNAGAFFASSVRRRARHRHFQQAFIHTVDQFHIFNLLDT